jgi:hypothetical protein
MARYKQHQGAQRCLSPYPEMLQWPQMGVLEKHSRSLFQEIRNGSELMVHWISTKERIEMMPENLRWGQLQ